jgi:2-polyprenyl-3-methyl-5-hydroxy-6-metoxy-1,4-benzoquinol methylase
MRNVKLIANVCVYNEVEKGNLDRCLHNLLQYCDEVIVYDDASTDGSQRVAYNYGCHVILGVKNDQMNELAHKQLLLDRALELGATHIFWLDCDEILDRAGTEGGIRALCENWPDGVDAYSFKETNLWRSQRWIRTDSLFDIGWFVRLWKVVPGIRFDVEEGVHLRLYPANIEKVRESIFRVIHYGFWNYKALLVKIGAHNFTREQLMENTLTNWILDERECKCYFATDNLFPKGTIPPDIWPEPQPLAIEDMLTYPDLCNDPDFPLMDKGATGEWDRLHVRRYHGSYEEIMNRNISTWLGPIDQFPDQEHLNLFQVNAKGKTLCDVGAGGGWHALEALRKGANKVYLMEVNRLLIECAARSFRGLDVNTNQYQLIPIEHTLVNLPEKVDIIYCMAVFMHIKFWQGKVWLRWMANNLKDDGEIHLQLYQVNNQTMFWNGVDSVSDLHMEQEMDRVGLEVISKDLAKGKDILPVWYLYRLVKRR